jgi:hypothetical protein
MFPAMPKNPILVLALATLIPACASHHEGSPVKSAERCTVMGAKTGVAGAKTGVTTGVEGVKTFGRSVGGYVQGGSAEADRQWHEGKADTKRIAEEGKAETKHEAAAPDCP